MAREVTMLRYRFNSGIWNLTITDDLVAERLGRAFTGSHLFGEEGRQYGFIDCRYSRGIVLGYFTQEGAKEIIRYDAKVNVQTTTERSFAHILFALHIRSGIVALQKTRIVGFVDMNLSDMRRQFPIGVEELMNSVNIPVIRLFLEQDRLEITTEHLYQIFIHYRTNFIRIVNLKGKTVPSYEEFKIFNPRVEDDMIYRQVFEEDIQLGLDRLELKSDESDNLGDTALARLGAVVGDITSLAVDPAGDGQSIPLTTRVADRFKVQISSDNEKHPVSADDSDAVARPLTLTLTLEGVQQDVAQLMRNLMALTAHYFADEGDGNDD